MKHKVSELEGALLDAAVAKAEGFRIVNFNIGRDGVYRGEKGYAVEDFVGYLFINGVPRYSPSEIWGQGGPIIERDLIEWEVGDAPGPGHVWYAKLSPFNEPFSEFFKGPTPLIAAMRAYVASKFGEEVDLP